MRVGAILLSLFHLVCPPSESATKKMRIWLHTPATSILTPSGAGKPVAANSHRAAGHGRRLNASHAGFTLVEAIVAVVIFSLVMLGVFTTLARSYHLAALSRCNDDARAVLRSYVDQFERLQTTEEVDEVDKDRYLFSKTDETGRGLVAPNEGLSDETVFVNLPEAANLPIILGEGDHAINATVTREVSYIDAASGEISEARQITASGCFMVMAIFRIRFRLNDKDYMQYMTVLRVAP